MGASWVRSTIGLLLLILTGCAADGGDMRLAGPATSAADTSEDCVQRIDLQVQDVLDAFEDAGNAGPAEGEAYRRLQDLPPPDCPEWDGAQAADALEEEALRRLEQLEQSGAELDAESYAALTGLAVVAAALRPAPTYAVPDGFPVEFPVVDGAQLVSSTREEGTVTAIWDVPGAAYQEVYYFYESALQSGVIGRWSVSRSSGGVMQGAGTVVSGDQRFEVTGHGHTGTVAITMAEGEEHVTIEATLTSDG